MLITIFVFIIFIFMGKKSILGKLVKNLVLEQ